MCLTAFKPNVQFPIPLQPLLFSLLDSYYIVMMLFLSQIQSHPFPRRAFGRTGCQSAGVHSLSQTPLPHTITTGTCATAITVTTPTPTKTKQLAQCLVIAMATMVQAPPTHQVQGRTAPYMTCSADHNERNGERERWRGIEIVKRREKGWKERGGGRDKRISINRI